MKCQKTYQNVYNSLIDYLFELKIAKENGQFLTFFGTLPNCAKQNGTEKSN